MHKISIDPKELYSLTPLVKGLMDMAFDASIIMDKNGILLHCSESSPLMFGVPNNESIGRHISELDSASPYPEMLQNGIPVLGKIHIINGMTCLTNMIPLFDGEGEIVGAFGNIIVRGIEKIKTLVTRKGEETSELYDMLSRAEAKYSTLDFIGCSEKIKEVTELTKKAARYDYPVLICGETGCGKELIASGIHTESALKTRKPFIRINCTAIPHDLLESELFGYEKGAFTGAYTTKHGKFEIAGDGTILLDEVGDLNASMQSKLLRVLEEREFERVGGNKLIPLRARVIASTNCNLKQLMEEGRFRRDLYYRLSGIEITIPPLRERKVDIPLLVRHFERQLGVEMAFTDAAKEVLLRYDWPGNVRELRNVINRLSVTEEQLIDDELLCRLFEGLREARDEAGPAGGGANTLSHRVEETEKQQIAQALAETGMCVSAAARALGISRNSLYNKMHKLNIQVVRGLDGHKDVSLA